MLTTLKNKAQNQILTNRFAWPYMRVSKFSCSVSNEMVNWSGIFRAPCKLAALKSFFLDETKLCRIRQRRRLTLGSFGGAIKTFARDHDSCNLTWPRIGMFHYSFFRLHLSPEKREKNFRLIPYHVSHRLPLLLLINHSS